MIHIYKRPYEPISTSTSIASNVCVGRSRSWREKQFRGRRSIHDARQNARSANSALQNIRVPGHYPVRYALSMLAFIVFAFLSAIDAFQAAGSKETALATIGTALAAVGAAFASFFSHETTAEGCKTVGGSEVSSNPTILSSEHGGSVRCAAGRCKGRPIRQQAMDRHDGAKARKCVVAADGLTKLPSIHGPSFASQQLAGVDLAGIASNQSILSVFCLRQVCVTAHLEHSLC